MKITTKGLLRAMLVNFIIVIIAGLIFSIARVKLFPNADTVVEDKMYSGTYVCQHLREGYFYRCNLNGVILYNTFGFWIIFVLIAYIPGGFTTYFTLANYFVIFLLMCIFSRTSGNKTETPSSSV